MQEWGAPLSVPGGKAASWDKLPCFLGKTEFHLVPQIKERSFWRMHLAPFSCKFIVSLLPWALMSPHSRPHGSRHPFRNGHRGPYLLTKPGRGSGESHSTAPPCCPPSNSWKFWNVSIFAAAFHQCHLSEFRTIILLKCFRCHISNP